MNLHTFESMLSIGETVAVEFKRCGNGIEHDVYESVCSFLNRFGGDLFMGVLDDGTVTGETVYLLVEAGSSSTSSTFMVNAEKVEASGLTVTKNSEGNYTLQSDSYRLNLVMTPSFSKVKTAMQLQQADGSALTGSDSYRIYYQYSYDNSWGDKSSSYNTIYLSYSGHQGDDEITGIATGGEFLITKLEIRDSSNNILAVLGADQQAISVNTIATEKQGILTQVTAEDTSISIKTEMMSNKNGRLRYRKKDEIEWSYYKDIISYYTNEVTLPAEADTDYVVELTDMDRRHERSIVWVVFLE